jgi:hypothetical protein
LSSPWAAPVIDASNTTATKIVFVIPLRIIPEVRENQTSNCPSTNDSLTFAVCEQKRSRDLLRSTNQNQ